MRMQTRENPFSVLREYEAEGDPGGAKRRGERKAEALWSALTSTGRLKQVRPAAKSALGLLVHRSAWSGNQQSNST